LFGFWNELKSPLVTAEGAVSVGFYRQPQLFDCRNGQLGWRNRSLKGTFSIKIKQGKFPNSVIDKRTLAAAIPLTGSEMKGGLSLVTLLVGGGGSHQRKFPGTCGADDLTFRD
jgi:hypothetical protein